jgi:hypothetical protein
LTQQEIWIRASSPACQLSERVDARCPSRAKLIASDNERSEVADLVVSHAELRFLKLRPEPGLTEAWR